MSMIIFPKCWAVVFNLYYFAWSQVHVETSNSFQGSQNAKPQCDLIITFKGYYAKEQRRNFIEHAFLRIQKDGRGNEFWIVDRDNRAYNDYPSDFDIVRLTEVGREATWYPSNLSHPAFKSVRIDKKVQSCPEHLCGTRNNSDFVTKGFARSIMRDIPGAQKNQIAVLYLQEAVEVWKMGATGSGVTVAVFDTGLGWNPDLKYIKGVTQWTDDNTEADVVGHGSFVTSVIASSDEFCPGIAPDAELLIFKVFNKNKVSRTSWFLDAFNYAMFQKVDIINLSIGGPDFEDKLFVEKVSEIVAAGIVFVSAIGNDGPVHGTLNNPADQMEVIGVGAVDQTGNVAQFSSRGMTTWELPHGYGRVKPDVLALGVGVIGKSTKNVCVQMQGTSVASPIVTGAIALILSANQHRKKLLNPAFVKQTLTSTATRLPNASMFVQGSGKLDIVKAFKKSKLMQPHVSVLPNYVDAKTSNDDSDYFWPYSSQPLYHSALPVKLNFTLVNSLSVTSQISSVPIWRPSLTAPDIVDMNFEFLPALWPWSGYFGLKMWIKPEGASFSGKVSGIVSFSISSYSDIEGSWKWIDKEIRIPLSLHVVPTPRREYRILWDVYHNLKYPNGYFPRDDLKNTRDLLDWYSDHPHTNFKRLYGYLRKMGMFIEILGQSFECFDAFKYQTLLIIDPEDDYHLKELVKLQDDVRNKGLSVLVVCDWWNAEIMNKIQYFDENTRSTKFPLTGGSNVPAVNKLLDPFGISLSDHIYYGTAVMGSKNVNLRSASSILRFPDEGFLVRVKLKDEVRELLENKARIVQEVPIAGILDLTRLSHTNHGNEAETQGRLAILTDTSCLEDTKVKQENNCFSFFHDLLKFAAFGELKDLKGVLKESSLPVGRNPLYHCSLQDQLTSFSKVVRSYEPYSEKHLDEQCERYQHNEVDFASQLLNVNESNMVDEMLIQLKNLKNAFKNDAYDVKVSVSLSEKSDVKEVRDGRESPSAGVSYSAGMLPFMRKGIRADYSRKIVQQEQPWILLLFIAVCGVFLLLVLCDMFVRRRRKRLCRRVYRIFRR